MSDFLSWDVLAWGWVRNFHQVASWLVHRWLQATVGRQEREGSLPYHGKELLQLHHWGLGTQVAKVGQLWCSSRRLPELQSISTSSLCKSRSSYRRPERCYYGSSGNNNWAQQKAKLAIHDQELAQSLPNAGLSCPLEQRPIPRSEPEQAPDPHEVRKRRVMREDRCPSLLHDDDAIKHTLLSIRKRACHLMCKAQQEKDSCDRSSTFLSKALPSLGLLSLYKRREREILGQEGS